MQSVLYIADADGSAVAIRMSDIQAITKHRRDQSRVLIYVNGMKEPFSVVPRTKDYIQIVKEWEKYLVEEGTM